MGIDREGNLEALQEAARRSLGPGGIGVGQDEEELVAAEVGDGVALPDALQQLLGRHFQEAIAGLVPQGIVDLLEAVEIQQHDRQRFLVPPRPRQGLLQTVVEEKAVRQAGQGVVVGEIIESGLGLLVLAQVDEGFEVQLSFFPHDGHDGLHDGKHLPVGSKKGTLGTLDELAAVDGTLPLFGGTNEAVAGLPEHVLPNGPAHLGGGGIGLEDPVALGVDDHHADLKGGEDRAQVVFMLLGVGLRLLQGREHGVDRRSEMGNFVRSLDGNLVRGLPLEGDRLQLRVEAGQPGKHGLLEQGQRTEGKERQASHEQDQQGTTAPSQDQHEGEEGETEHDEGLRPQVQVLEARLLYLQTRFTKRPETTTSLIIVFPRIFGAIASSLLALARISSWEASAGTTMRARILPLIWTTSSTSLSRVKASS